MQSTHDEPAVCALLVRQVESDRLREAAEKDLAPKTRIEAITNTKMNIRATFNLF